MRAAWLVAAVCSWWWWRRRWGRRGLQPRLPAALNSPPTATESVEEVLRVMEGWMREDVSVHVRGVPLGARARRTLLLLHGWSESRVKYAELVDVDLLGSSSSSSSSTSCDRIVVVDLLGHGSKRTKGQHRGVQTHLDRFADLVNDAKAVYALLRREEEGGVVVVMGFSLGGLVAARMCMDLPVQQSPDALVLVAPCFVPRTGYPSWVLHRVVQGLRGLGCGEWFVPGHPSGVDHVMRHPPHSRVSSSLARVLAWERCRELCPDLCINGMSIAFLGEMIANRIDTPDDFARVHVRGGRILCLVAEHDEFVENDPIFQFCAHRESVCELWQFPGAKHELFQERNEIRSRVVRTLVEFLD